jgi:hypothetical protein
MRTGHARGCAAASTRPGTLGFPRATHRDIRVVQITARKAGLLSLHHSPERNSWHLENQLGIVLRQGEPAYPRARRQLADAAFTVY